jgi:hypothetical protein
MKINLPCLPPFAVVLALAAVLALRAGARADEAEQEKADDQQVAVGDQLVERVATQLERRTSITAKMRHQIFLGRQQLYGLGNYWQQGRGEDLRVRLELQIAGQEASLLQVSDSRFVWVDRNLPSGRSVTRVDLRQLRATPTAADGTFGDMEPGTATWSAVHTDLLAHVGGLPGLFAGLKDHFSFMPPQPMRLAAQTTGDAQSSSLPVFAVVGHWRPEKLAALLKEGTAWTNLPERMPQEVLLLVDQATLFPYRLEYRQLETPRSGGGGPEVPYQLSNRPLVVLEFTEVVFDKPIEPGQFDYIPGDVNFVDQTAVVLERQRVGQQSKVATRSDAAAESAQAR